MCIPLELYFKCLSLSFYISPTVAQTWIKTMMESSLFIYFYVPESNHHLILVNNIMLIFLFKET